MSGRVGEDSDAPKGPHGGGAPTINGSIEASLTPELLFRMNKKIAQLTKVVYGLNTRGEELEAQLATAKESEEALKTNNTELQHRLNHCKSKVETELGRLRELEAEAGQAHYWKHECENLRRRLDLEGGVLGGGGVLGSGEARAAVAAAREDAERAHRREKAVAYELDQARQAINSLKSHHDFIMRERDAQEAMEREKLELEWQTRLAEIENRYKSQVRRVTDDMEVLTAECDILRRRAADCGTGEASLREQMMAMERDHEKQRRDWEMQMQMKVQDEQEEILAFGKERRDFDARIRQLHEERRDADQQWEERLREKSREYERKLREAIDKRDAMQQRIDEKEESFEARLRSKVDEWKAEWDEVEEGLRSEIRKLKNENESLRADVTVLRSRQERGSIESEMKVRELEEAIQNKDTEFENKTRNLMIRLSTVESANKQQGQEKNAAERQMREEKERNRQLKMDYEILGKVKQDLEQRVKLLTDSERQLDERVTLLTVENDEMKSETEDLKQKLKAKEKEMATKMEAMTKTSEARVKQRIEKTWLEKLRRSEENAAQDLERLRDAHRRTEGALRKEITQAKKAEEEARRLNEEFKKKVRTLRQAETEATHKITELDDRVQELTKKHSGDSVPKELGAQEERYQKQIDELTLSLAEKQDEVSKLGQTLETLKGVQETLANTEELQEKLSLLQQDVRDRNAQLDCARTELETSKEEMELTKAKLNKLEEDLDTARQKNLALQNQIAAKTNCDKTEELETKIKTMEETLKKMTEERDQLAKTIDETEAERDEEIKIIQDALDEAAQEREDLISTFEKEIQNMTTMNSTREQQLMEDFEWKLREMEKDHKKKMEERDRKAEVGHLKSYEAEAIQLRGVTNELQKALRASAREMEHLKVREKILEEEIRGLKKAPASRQSTLQRAKRQAEETEAEFRQKQEKMKNELNAEWEDKLRSECSRLKAELDELHAEEKHLAVESMKVQKEQEIRKLKQSWELRQEEMTKEMSKLKDSLTEKDAYYHKEMENMRTNADRDVWELRRKLQRLDEKNWSAQELLQEKHHEELERIRADYKERMSDLEARLEVAMKDSDEDARQQAEKMHNDEMEHLCEQHRLSMERLREELEAEKFQAVEEARVIVTKHHEYVNVGLREQITEATNNCTQYREELEAVKSTVALKEEMIKTLEDELARLRETEGVPAASYKDSQNSIASSSESTCSQGSSNSQDRLSLSESVGASIDSQDETHKSGIYRLVFAFLSLMFLKYILSDIGVTLMGLGLAVLVLSWARARLRKGQAPPARHQQ
ncbi:trichohyalin-like isoform X2 [Portunus trituberculatus]|uniref:trichohyalin-like isoform X2 n=1 Tax=Portunus trituberculatus TaxID=210409 RepID=UPI001E1CBBAC|nr:trichohyalin-like isoform X2 [Portunus trituberculatus]